MNFPETDLTFGLFDLTTGDQLSASVPGIPDIDLMAETLDSRVTYTGPAHYFMAQDGSIKQSTANQWPVEYIGGIAVGRSDPEPASTNLMTAPVLDNLTSTTSGNITQYRETTANSYHRVRVSDSLTNQVQSAQIIYKPVGRTSFYFRAPILDASTNSNAAVSNGVLGYVSPNFVSASVRPNGDLRVFQLSFNDKASADGFLTSNVPITDNSIPVFTGDVTKGFDSYFIQTESSAQSTSPLAMGATRTASSVVIDTTGATTITLYYSDKTSQNVAVSGSYTLPMATLNWGARYITRISLKA